MDLTLLKSKIIESLNLEETRPEEIDENAPLFGPEGLGLDSIDALELIVMLEKNWGIKITDPKTARDIFTCVASIGEYIDKNSKF